MYCFIIQSKLMIGNSWRKYSNSSIRKNLISKPMLFIIIGAFLFDGIVLYYLAFYSDSMLLGRGSVKMLSGLMSTEHLH